MAARMAVGIRKPSAVGLLGRRLYSWRNRTRPTTTPPPSSHCDGFEFSSSRKHTVLACLGSSVLVLFANKNSACADDGPSSVGAEAYLSNLQRIEDGSVVSNMHTVKWRVYTDNGRSLFLQGSLEEAEKYFSLALQEAKDGFGERDAHVASSLNNLAELYRVRKELGKAEPLYMDAIEILEESFGPDDIRVAVAFHNLGQFYVVQRKLDDARGCYERALKIKRRVLGLEHPDYADTMYHLGTVLHLLGRSEDSKALIADSIRILEDGGLGESAICLRRMKHLARILSNLNRLNEVETLQRKMLHIFELSKGWNSVETISTAENLALTLQSLGNLSESQELLERCLDASKCLLGEGDVRMTSSMVHLARNSILYAGQLKETDPVRTVAELGKARVLVDESLVIARSCLANRAPPAKIYEQRFSLILLLRSLDAMGLLEATGRELPQWEDHSAVDSCIALRECISVFKDPRLHDVWNLPDVRVEYLSCLKHLLGIVEGRTGSEVNAEELQDLKDEVVCIEAELASRKYSKST